MLMGTLYTFAHQHTSEPRPCHPTNHRAVENIPDESLLNKQTTPLNRTINHSAIEARSDHAFDGPRYRDGRMRM